LGGCGSFIDLGTRSLTRYHIGHCGCQNKPPELCTKCGKNPPRNVRTSRQGFECKDCHNARSLEWDIKNLERRILRSARARAKKFDRAFSLQLTDIIIP